ncbi:hypothetical protein Tco_0155786 [Tanacetum coccineum]
MTMPRSNARLSHSRTTAKPQPSRSRAAAEPSRSQVAPFIAETSRDHKRRIESTEVDAPPVNDDNANANEGNAEDDDVAHVLDDDDDVVVSDDDEVNPSTNVEEVLDNH